MEPAQCGHCHQVEYEAWTHSKHRQIAVQCGACHGQLHSGKIEGCRQCHGDKHGTIFQHWPAVQRFDLPGSSDYVCIVCHHPHTSALDEHRQACTVCHNQNLNRDVAAFHATLSEVFVPTENDAFVVRESIGVRIAELPPVVRGMIAMPVSILAFVLGGMVLLPVGVGFAVLGQAGRRVDSRGRNRARSLLSSDREQ